MQSVSSFSECVWQLSVIVQLSSHSLKQQFLDLSLHEQIDSLSC